MTNPVGSQALAEYQSIKIVRAGRIHVTDASTCAVELADGRWGVFAFETNMTARYTPVPGDYWVVYEDGYQSISPKHAFESGYLRLDEAKMPQPQPVNWWEALPEHIKTLARELCLDANEQSDLLGQMCGPFQVPTPSGVAWVLGGSETSRPLWTFWVHAATRALDFVKKTAENKPE